MNELKLFDQVTKTDVLSTVFADGMIVNSGDLTTSMNYPMEMFRTLVRAYFGCGVVCGLELEKYPSGDTDTWCLKVHPGTALDCNANPLKLCESVIVSLKPDPCVCGDWPDCVCIAIRRDTLPEGARTDTDDCDGNNQCSYRRLRETVRVKAFTCNEIPKNTCMRSEQSVHDTEQDRTGSAHSRLQMCECLKACGDCECCDDSWVLLGCVMLGECGIEEVDMRKRKYVKPTECHCPPPVREEPQYQPDGDHGQPATSATANAKKVARKKVAKKKTG